MNKEFSEIIGGFKRTLSLIEKPERKLLLFASFIMLITGTLTNLPAVVLGKLVDKMLAAKTIQFEDAIPFLLLIVFIILIREALTVYRKYIVENIATQTDKKITVTVIDRLLKTDIEIINSQQIGSLHGKIFRSVQGLIRLIKLVFLEFMPVFFSALAAFAIAFYQKPFIATLMILVVPTGLLIIFKQISSQKGIRVWLLRGKEKIDGSVVEMLGGLETVRVLNTEKDEVRKIERVAEELRKREIAHHISMALFDAGKYLNEGFFYIVIITLSIYLSARGVISRGDILVYSILYLSITGPLAEIHRILDQAHESSILVNDLYGLLNEPIDVSFGSGSEATITIIPSEIISIQNLSFSYPKRKTAIFNDLSLSIRKGEKVGIAGASGDGKSTLLKILLRLTHGYTGKICVFGKDLRLLTREEIARRVAYVPQKPYIFSGSIRDNLVYGCSKNISNHRIIEAAKKAHIYDEIMDSLGGFDGKVTENGNNLSGGQRQRIAIARLILKSPDLLVFDEATSALDNTNEAVVAKNIESLFKDKTMITIAHRLTTLKNSDRILVFNKGKIVQEGSFTKLSKQEGLFKDFLEQRS